MSNRRFKLACAAALVVFGIGCGPSSKAPRVTDSNSNWLAACEVTADCEGDGSCICGLCTATCSDDRDCSSAGPGASCVRPGEASGEVACAAIVEAAGESVCLAECTRDADCNDDSRCVEGSCWAEPSSVIDRRDAGMTPSMQAPDAAVVMMPPRAIDAGIDVWALDASVDFSDPPVRPMPQQAFQGEDLSGLLGVWSQQQAVTLLFAGPMRLEITEQRADGSVTGTIAFMCEPGACDPEGPLPAVTDPDLGFPPGMSAGEQATMRLNILPRMEYRIFDARLVDGRLTFWFSNNDVWREWCPMQTPYATVVDAQTRYACVPEAQPFFDMFSRITEDDDESITGPQLLCSIDSGPCRCDAARCDLDYHGSMRTLDFELEGNEMRGIFGGQTDTHLVILTREPPVQP
jgi:hypothetical protein